MTSRRAEKTQTLQLLNADSIRAAARKRKSVDVDLGDGTAVRMMALTAGAGLQFQAEVQEIVKAGGDPETLGPVLIARSWVDDSGEPLLPEEEGKELALSFEADKYNRLAAAALKLNGLSENAVADALKNSGATRTDSTPSGSPETSVTPT